MSRHDVDPIKPPREETLRITIPGKPPTASGATSPKTPPPTQTPPRTLLRVQGGEKYELGPIIARGGMGVIREALDVQCRRVVAIKELSREKASEPEEVRQFLEEARITARLEHPNIVPIHELGFDSDRNAFYSMKFVKGMTLADVLLGIRRGQKETIEQYPLPRLLNVFQKVCDAVAFAHSKGIVHCDLKPDNIMLCDFGQVLVMDWGLARPIGSPAGWATPGPTQEPSAPTAAPGGSASTSTGQIMGTPGFIAPERIRPGAVLNPASDIYALGATLYSLLVLRAPLAGLELRTQLVRVLTGNITPPAAYNDPDLREREWNSDEPVSFLHCHEGRIPPALSDIVMKAMATHVADRYASVQEFQTDIEAYQNGQLWSPVLDQDFSGPEALAPWEVLSGQAEIKNGELHLSHGEPQILLLKAEMPGDVRIEFEARQEGVYLNALGAFMGAVRSANAREMVQTGYKFEYGGFDNSLNGIERNGRSIVSEHASPLERDLRFQVCVERCDSRLRMVVNGREVFSVLDPDPLSGPDRTAVGLFGWLAETVVTRIRVSAMGTPWKRDMLDIAESQVFKGNYAVAEVLLKEVIASSPGPERLQRAQKAFALSAGRQRLMQQLESWKEKLRQAWPGAPFDLRLSNDGFALEISNCGIEELEPLRGLPLTSLMCAHNGLRDLEPLRGMPLTAINCSGTRVTDLEPLRGMKLNTFVCEMGLITDLEPLRDMPLLLVNIGGSRVETLEPLRGMNLTFLSCWGNGLKTLEPLRGMKCLAALYCNANELENLEPLTGVSLVTLNTSGNRLRRLDPLRGMPLGVLHAGDNLIESLEPLRGLPLRMLSCQHNRITDLEPVQGLPLGSLMCGDNPIASLETFILSPPDDFRYESDTLPTAELERLQSAWTDKPQLARHWKDLQVLLALRRRDLPRLRALADEFRGHRYLVVPKFMTWDDARLFCEQLGGHLVTIPDRETNDFLNALFVNGAWFWMGLRRTERGHEWADGTPSAYSNFVDTLQERKIGPAIFSGRWAFDDVPGAHNAFMIEWEA